MKISFAQPTDHYTAARDHDTIVFLVDHASFQTPHIKIASTQNVTYDAILRSDPAFAGKTGQSLSFPYTVFDSTQQCKKAVLLGVGNAKKLTALSAEAIGSQISKQVRGKVFVSTEFLSQPIDPVRLADMANGALLKSYQFEKYKTDTKKVETELVFGNEAEADFAPRGAVTKGVFLARDLANEPPNVINPMTLSDIIVSELKPLGIKIRVIDEVELKAMGAGAILAVGMGSDTPPRIVTMEYDGTGGKTKGWPLALVGKGLTFDTGGISLKSDGGKDMKFDMCGAAAVIGTMRALAARGAKAKVVGVVGLAENAIGPGAYRNDDIIKPLGKKTFEINNTDAEGRLVLIDCLAHVQNAYKPKAIIDLATLTGACVGALGHTMAGIFSNNDGLWKKIDKAGQNVNELGWRLPLHENFTKATQGTYADLKNSAGQPGASTAAAFLQEYIEPGVKWAHMDIAGMANGVNGHPTMPDGIGTGFGIRLLDRLIADYYEDKRGFVAAPAPQKKLAP